MSWRRIGWVIAAAAAVLAPSVGMAHGSNVAATVTRQVTVDVTVAVEANYHSGRPMAGALVTVLAPGSPDEPWMMGECDAEGRFEFAPPVDRPGTWEVLVYSQGHGGRVSVEIADEGQEPGKAVVTAESSSTAHLTLLQKFVMGACVIWGLLGTALFFSRRRG
jgi:nickel transport protein